MPYLCTMEKYLKEGESLKRLLKDYRDFGTLIVAVDFDDTLFDFCGEGYNCDKVKSLLQDLDAVGCEIAIWTANQDVEFVEQYLKDNNIPFNCINEECPTSEKWLEGKEYRPRKIFAHAYLDDRAGLRQVYNELCEFVNYIKMEEEKMYMLDSIIRSPELFIAKTRRKGKSWYKLRSQIE